jgi:uncharacterized Zn finger protein
MSCAKCGQEQECLVATSAGKSGMAFLRYRCLQCGAIQDALELPGPRPLDGYHPTVEDTVIS